MGSGIRYAARQLLSYRDVEKIGFKSEQVESIPAWNGEHELMLDDDGWFKRLEDHGVFFSSPLDLDFLMMTAYPEAYGVRDGELKTPDADSLKAVLGKRRDTVERQYTEKELKYFDAYYFRFKLGSKPAWHIQAMANLTDQELSVGMPEVLERLLTRIREELKGLPE